MEQNMMLKNDWFFPDAFLPNPADGISHEAVCVLNMSRTDANVELVLYFEDSEKIGGFRATCPPERTKHIRIDQICNADGRPVPADKPYAIWVHSDQPILCQYTRVDASIPARTMITAMGL